MVLRYMASRLPNEGETNAPRKEKEDERVLHSNKPKVPVSREG